MRSIRSCLAVGTLLGVMASALACGNQALDPRDPCAVIEEDGQLRVGCPDGTQAVVRGDQLCMSDAQGAVQSDECFEELTRFGFATDLHYADLSAPDSHFRSLGTYKLREATSSWNKAGVDLAIMGGDYIDPQDESDAKHAISDLRRIEDVFERVEAPRYHVLGNHDLDVFDKDAFAANTIMERPYYSFDRRGVHFVFLDANYRAPRDDAHYDGNSYDFRETWISPNQLAWLEDDLEATDLPTLVFSHQCLPAAGVPYVNNAADVRRILETSGKVVGVINGHAHRNNRMKVGDIPYFMMQAMTRGQGRRNAHAVVRLYEGDWILVHGSAYQASYLDRRDDSDWSGPTP